ncbi:MAG: hypothetical protein J3Q66DRAFT_359775 [Benniella sp.]|nr:MAG: hypothetical protein J3Q66DRAFT_359775 [Benniella sp.]
MIPTKDNDSLLFFSGNTTYQFNIKSNEWAKDPFMTWTYPAFDKAVVTDTDTGLIYGIERETIGPPVPGSIISIKLRFTEFDPVTKKHTSTELQDQDFMTRRTLLYSKLSKAIYSYMEIGKGEKRLFSYNIASKTWSVVNATGDIPSYRAEPCFVSAYGGKKLILAAGADTDPRSDVYSFDVATSIWTRLADAPRATWGHTCAASEDSFIIWGGYGVDKDDKDVPTNNGDGPIILNMATNTWDNKYTPSGQTPISSANHAHMVSKVGTVALMVATFTASSLFF